MKRVILTFVLHTFIFCYFVPTVLAQNDFCRPVPVSLDPKRIISKSASDCPLYTDCDIADIRNNYLQDSTSPTKYVQLYFHILANDDGSAPLATVEILDSVVSDLNQFCSQYKLQYEFKYDYVNKSAYRTLQTIEESYGLKIEYAVEHMAYCNTYITNVDLDIGSPSWSVLPLSSQGLLKINGVVMHYQHLPPWYDSEILCHELGHAGGLFHTFHGVDEVPACEECYETPRNFDTDHVGDYCSDTPPNPRMGGCEPSPDNDPCSRLPWAPNDAQINVMSYGCKEKFTPQQMARYHCYMENTYPDMFHYIRGIPDTTIGKGQLTVNFQGFSEYVADEWIWVFNETDTQYVQNPTYQCMQPGYNPYRLSVVTSLGDTLSRAYKDEILVVGDTISVGTTEASPGEQFTIPVYLNNFVPVDHISLAFVMDGDDIVFDSFTTVNQTGEDFYSSLLKNYDGFNNRFSINLTNYEFDTLHQLQPGMYQLVDLHYTVKETATHGTTVSIAPESYNTYVNSCNTNTIVYQPYTKAGTVTVNCCKNIRGNINYDIDDVIDISDLLYFVDFLFAVPSGEPPVCMEEADVNASSEIDISDLLYMVDYFFATPPGPAPLSCD